jgi:uncharacterized protein (DUF1778 family)
MRKAAREADVAELDALLARLEKSPAVEAVQRLLDAYDYAALTAVLDDPPDSEERLGQARNGVRHDA